MAYNPNYYYPAGYQPMQIQPQVQQMPQMQNNVSNGQSGILWVQGEAGAKAYPVGAGNSVLLMDTEDTVLYLKTVDQSGMPQPLRIFDLVERTAANRSSNAVATHTEVVSREEFEELRDEVTRLSKGIRKAEVKEADNGKPSV